MKTVLRACALMLMLCLCATAVALDAAKKPAAHAAKRAGKAKVPEPIGPVLIWRGDHNVARAFMKDWAADYEKSRQGRIVLQPFSTISGLDAINAGTADIAGSSRPPMPGRVEEQGTNFLPIAWDGLVMITSPKNPISNLTLKQVHDIYLGDVTDWSALGGEPGEINLYGIAPPLDGDEYSLRELIFHHGDQAVSIPRLYVNLDKLEEGMALDPHGLGLSTYSSAHANPALKMMTIEGIAASTATIADGSYPLYSTLFLAAREDSKNHEAIVKFAQFTATEPAQEILRRHGLVPYSEGQNLITKQAERVAWVDARVRPGAAPFAAAAESGTPVSAPNATADFLTRMAPNSLEAQEAKDRAARLSAEKKAAEQPDGD
ncbi:MAG TPA: substrate-binding domain-containing protein [Rudaea sp.]|jgi:phosphate transport system substrate-binding protein